MKNKCSVKNCNNNIHACGLCCSHYHRLRRYGSFVLPKSRREKLCGNGFSYCYICKKELPINEFYKDSQMKFGISQSCKKCSKLKSKNRYCNNKDKYREYKIKKEFGIDTKKYNEILKSQNYKCAICEKNLMINSKYRKPSIDHCHKTNIVRGVLCDCCNLGLGQFKDNKIILQKAINYLEIREKPSAQRQR